MIKLSRTYRALTQIEVAAAVAIERGDYNRIERGRLLNVSDSRVRRLSEVLDFPSSFFYDVCNWLPAEVSFYPLIDPNPYFGKRIKEKVISEIELRLFHLQKSTEILKSPLKVRTRITERKTGSPCHLAHLTRARMGFELNPIVSLNKAAWKIGLNLIKCRLDEPIHSIIARTPNDRLVLFVNQDVDVFILKASIAGGIGIALFKELKIEVTKSSIMKFVCELLLPSQKLMDISTSAGLSLEKLNEVTREWMIPENVLYFQLMHLGLIDKRTKAFFGQNKILFPHSLMVTDDLDTIDTMSRQIKSAITNSGPSEDPETLFKTKNSDLNVLYGLSLPL